MKYDLLNFPRIDIFAWPRDYKVHIKSLQYF